MGPGGSSSFEKLAYLPSRSKFSWNIRNVPLTDVRGEQFEYARNVNLWKRFHDQLASINSNKISPNLQGIMLLSQLFGSAINMCKSIPDEVVESKRGERNRESYIQEMRTYYRQLSLRRLYGSRLIESWRKGGISQFLVDVLSASGEVKCTLHQL